MTSSTVVPAPGEGAFVSVALANTLVSGSRGAFDRLDDERSLAGWLAEHPLPGVAVGSRAGALKSLRAMRAAIRGLLSARVHGHPLDPTDLHRVNRTAATVGVVPALHLSDHGVAVEVWVPAAGVDEVEAAIARDAIALLASASAARLRECQADDCDRLFVQAHGRSRWCSPGCGSRARAARHYAKARGVQLR